MAVLQVQGGISCHEENLPAIIGSQGQYQNQARMTVVPAGFHFVEQSVMLDPEVLSALPARKLYSQQHIVITDAVTASELDAALDALKTDRFVLCPIGLKQTVARKCNMLETRIITAEGTLVLVDNDLTLTNARLQRLGTQVTLANFAEMHTAPELDADLFNARVTAILNFGEIIVPAQLLPLVEAAITVADGSLEAESPELPIPENTMVGNVGYLRL